MTAPEAAGAGRAGVAGRGHVGRLREQTKALAHGLTVSVTGEGEDAVLAALARLLVTLLEREEGLEGGPGRRGSPAAPW